MSEGSDRPLWSWLQAWNAGWDRFWFTPRGPQTLAIIRIACGAMLAYVHIVWASLIHDFMGANAWMSVDVVRSLHRTDWTWSWLWYTENPTLLWLHQAAAIIASLLMMVGLLTRVAIPIAWWLTLMVCHRMTGALFGLDQVVVMLSMYLMLSHCGSTLSVDARLRNRYVRTGRILSSYWVSWLFPAATPSVANNVATRLLQLHLCVIYLFGGLSKMRGEMWFDGSALWYSAVNYEYQSLDITWIGRWRILVASLTALTIFWETFYVALVWPRLTRPLVLAMAVLVHGGIAVALGMVTFGSIMIVANLAFVEPRLLLRLWGASSSRGIA
ncbi:MAG: hypothetical protein KDA51_04675 [Planctomycetales bacterium]|nr:hypothetical protein [Planctomycetales bacterium]